MRVVIVGGGQIGSALARALAAQHEVVVIDHEPDVADAFQSIDVEFVTGSGTSAEVLARANVAGADVFVAATGLDEVNVVACALASRLGKADTICLVSRADFVGSAGDSGLGAFGINRIVWPEAQLAADIERIVTAPGAIDAEVIAGGVVRLLEYKLEAGSPLIATTLGGLHLPRGSLIVAVKRSAPYVRAARGNPAAGRRQGDRDGHAGGDAGRRSAAEPRSRRRPRAGHDHRRRRRRPGAGRAARAVAGGRSAHPRA